MRKFLLSLAILSVSPPGLQAQDNYPSKPMRMVVGFPPGGGTDIAARILAPHLSNQLGQPVIIENRPGATGTTAAAQVATAPGDGYTLMMGHVSVNAIVAALVRADTARYAKIVKDIGLKLD